MIGRKDRTTAEAGDRRWLGFAPLVIPGGLLVAHAPTWFLFGDFTPRIAIVVGSGAIGLLALAFLACRRDRPAQIAATLALWILVAALFSGAPLLAVKGTMGREVTGLIVVLGLGLWALGRTTPRQTIDRLPVVLLAGLGLNAVAGIAQVLFAIDSGWLSAQFGRSTGLTPNPVYLGALMAAGAGLTAAWRSWTLTGRAAGVAAFALVADLSGSRVALVSGFAATVGVAIADRKRLRAGLAVVLPVAFAGGVAVSTLLGVVLPTSRTSTERLSGADAGGRVTAWRYGLDAFADRPLFGYGFGRFRAATQDRFSPEFVRKAASDDVRQAWFDAHNVVIGVLVATGVVGLLLTVWFVVEASRRTDAQLRIVVLAIALTWLMQPVALATFPLAMFVLGAARAETPPTGSPLGAASLPWTWPVQATFLVGILAAGWLVIGDVRMQAAIDRGDPAALARAAEAFPRDPVVADLVAQAHLIDPALHPEALRWSQRAIEDEPDRPYLWRQHGMRLFLLGRREDAIAAFQHAIDLQPWHVQSWQGLYVVGGAVGDEELMAAAHAKLCVLGAPIGDDPCR